MSPRALDWVHAENTKTLAALEKDRRYPAVYADALKIAESHGRIPFPEFIAGKIYNFWQDAEHVRGIWRSTALADYPNPSPHWDTVLDLDALAKSERANWAWEGANCLWPSEKRCLVELSNGGEDAHTVREYDIPSRSFVSRGFVLPHGKQTVIWENTDALLVSREWEPGELTTSGYPYVVKRLLRGQPLSASMEVFRGRKSDAGVDPYTFHDAQGETLEMIVRELSYYVEDYYLVTPHGVRHVDLPHNLKLTGLLQGRLIFKLNEDWTAGGKAFKEGSLVSIDLKAMKADPDHLAPALVYEPGPRDSLSDAALTRTHLVLTTLHNVVGRTFVYTPMPDGSWASRELALPGDSTVGIADADARGENVIVGATGFLSPTTFWLANLSTRSLAIAKALPAQFDASRDVVDEREALSNDGTEIPYFVVHPKNMALNGANPTILYAYGGFQISSFPRYDPVIGKLWLERGGVYVVANIRGGGEFGPAWHDAAIETKRQTAFNDFVSVAEDLIARKVTSPAYLGIQGDSNGGLLMGVEFTQHPELYHAVNMVVPILDMLRFEKIGAGASWVGEYGSASDPTQRAFLASISPYNNIRAGVKYPEPFIETTTTDDRVTPAHARKFAARLSEMDIPYLFYLATDGGHDASGAKLSEQATHQRER